MNQNNYRPALLSALKESLSNGSLWHPTGIIDSLEKRNNPLEHLALGGSGLNQLLDVLSNDFGFIRNARHGYEMTQIESQRLTELLRWFRIAIESYEPNDNITLSTIFVVAVQIQDGRTLWREITFKRHPDNFLQTLKQLLSQFSCKLSTQGQRAPIWETEAAIAFEEATMSGDFVHIESVWTQMTAVLAPSFMQYQAASCLAYHDSPRLLETSHVIKDVVTAVHTIGALPTSQMLILATMSNSTHIKFGALLELCCERSRIRGKSLNKHSQKHLVNLILSVSKNPKHWEQFITAFNRYPSRYPILHSALGSALADMSEVQWQFYLSSFESTGSFARASVSMCMRAFHEKADDESCEQFFTMVYNKWREEVRDCKDSQHHFDLFMTPLDFGVVAYLINYGGIELIESEIGIIKQNIKDLPHQWYPSTSDAITAYNRCVSLLQVYYRAIHVTSQNKDLLFERFFIPQDIHENRYLSLSFPSRWHENF